MDFPFYCNCYYNCVQSKIMCKCSHPNCQFEQFLFTKQNQEIFYFEDKENIDNYCIFHTPLKIKQNFRISQKELFSKIIDDYFVQSILKKENLNFKDVVFLDYDFRDKILTGLEIDFTNTTFMENIRFDNLKCKKLILKDTKFLDGGGLKNRGEDKNLFIEELEFRPYILNSDFVIDIGAYASDEGLIELNKQGVIEKLRFENHKIGDGKIFFIGLNKDLIKADFRNMILDNVFFQNCDLRNCYFLNSKINTTEFRNCYFPQNDNRKFIGDVLGRKESIAFIALVFLLPFVFDVMSMFIKIDTIIDNILTMIYTVLIVSFIPIFLASLNSLEQLISYYIRKISDKLDVLINKNQGNKAVGNHKKSFNVHFCIADEKDIYTHLENHSKIKNKNSLEHNKETLQKTLDSLSSSYSQLKDNFKDTDFQISGDFFYSQRYTEILANSKKSFNDWMMYNFHQFTNGFGESYMKPLIWFVLVIVSFAFPFTLNKDYISTSATPLFLIKDANTSNLNSILYIYDKNNTKNSFFNNLTVVNYEQNNSILYGYDNRYNYHIQEQFVLELDENQSTKINLIHSFSNMIYPFAPEQKRWFQNISEKAVFYSLLESILLWYFAIAFILALWHRIKR